MEKETARPKPEIVGEWFFPAPVYTREGAVVPAPYEALQKYLDMHGDWLVNYPKGEGAPCVSLFPVISLEKEGYIVQALVYKRRE